MPEQASKPALCFIDDADFELDMFREHAAAAFSRVDMVYAKDFDRAAIKLEDRPVVGFLLDLYGTDPKAATPRLPGRESLEPELAGLRPLGELYHGVEDASSEAGNRFLRRLHGQVRCWQGAFGLACVSLGQSPDYGLLNLARVRERYPWAAALAYSRKSAYADADRATRAGAEGSLQKPQGGDEEAIARATERQAPELARAVYQVVDRRLAALAAAMGLRLCQQGERFDLVQALADTVAALGLGPDAGAAPARGEVARALQEVPLEDAGLTGPELATLLTLRAWLRA